MVVTTPKPLEEILAALGDSRRWVVMGCAECAAICQTGGSAQVDEMAQALEERGMTVLAAVDLPSPCDRRLTRRDLKRIAGELEQADGIVCLACGGGAQAVASLADVPVVVGLDAHFLGTVERVGRFHEECAMCGACVINETGGICPVTRCPKGLRNGPCEGSRDGACDVHPERACAWEEIHGRLEARGLLEGFEEVRPPLDPAACARPRSTGGEARR